MQATHIRDGIWYAISTSPRKGISPEALHRVDGIRKYRVLGKGLDRFAPTAKDVYGDKDGEWKKDGVKVTPDAEEVEVPTYKIIKPRDVLMPWNEYETRKEQDAAEAVAREAERTRLAEEREKACNSLRERLDILGFREYEDYTKQNQYELYNERQIRMPVDEMHRLLDTISEQVYELLSNAE